MKQKLIYFIAVFLFMQNVFAQTPNRAPEKIKQDSIEFEKFKKENLEKFRNKRLPISLLNGSYAIPGYSTAIQIKNNHIKDSVYHNFHPGMPDTSTVTPYNDIKVTDASVNINLFRTLFITGGTGFDSASITPVNMSYILSSDFVQKGLKEKKNLSQFISDYKSDSTEIRISINGKLLFNWKKLSQFKKETYETDERSPRFGNVKMTAFAYGYAICDTTIGINDQLLIEIKEDKKGWMIDRYNITRISAMPVISSLVPFDIKNKTTEGQSVQTVSLLEKKTLF
jgi:hypothetical protein